MDVKIIIMTNGNYVELHSAILPVQSQSVCLIYKPLE